MNIYLPLLITVITGLALAASLKHPPAIADARVQALRQAIALLPEGKELLEFADKTDIAIEVTKIDHVGGRVTTWRTRATLKLNADTPDQGLVTTVFHELHHLRQLSESGRLGKGGIPRFPRSEDALFSYLIAEADAYAFQTFIALKFKEAGYPQYLEGFLSYKNDTMEVIERFLARNPKGDFPDAAAFSRALFTVILTYGLQGYEKNFFTRLAGTVGRLETTEDVRKILNQTRGIPPQAASEFRGHADIYGPGFLKGPHMQDARNIISSRISPDRRMILQAAETLENEASSLTQERLDALKNAISRNRKTKN